MVVVWWWCGGGVVVVWWWYDRGGECGGVAGRGVVVVMVPGEHETFSNMFKSLQHLNVGAREYYKILNINIMRNIL